MQVTLATVKGYMRVDGSGDDAIIKLLMGSAAGFLSEAGIPEPTLSDEQTAAETAFEDAFPLYTLAVCALTLHYYDNRDAITQGNAVPTPLGLLSIITQLQVSNLDTIT